MTSINRYAGEWTVRNSDGEIKEYYEGDVVQYKGNSYVAMKTTSGFTPLHEESRSGWRKITSDATIAFTNSEKEPETPKDGDIWFNSSLGKLFIYIKDKDTEQWVEL